MNNQVDVSFEKCYNCNLDLTNEIKFQKLKRVMKNNSATLEKVQDMEEFFIHDDNILITGYVEGDTLYIENIIEDILIIKKETD